MKLPRLFATVGLTLALLGATTACDYLRDQEPWDQTIRYHVEGSLLKVEPLVIEGDANWGIVNVINDTPIRRGFAIRDLAVFEEIPPGLTIQVQVTEARDGETYTWTDHLNEGQFEGKLVIEYVDEEFRDR